MKVRSKALYHYLQQAGVLNGAPEAIALAKRQYRSIYKRQWRQLERPRKEIRIVVSVKQFEAIRHHAVLCGLRLTPYAREAILASVEAEFRPLNGERLSGALQLVSMAVNSLLQHRAAPQAATAMLTEAETLLISLVKKQNNSI